MVFLSYFFFILATQGYGILRWRRHRETYVFFCYHWYLFSLLATKEKKSLLEMPVWEDLNHINFKGCLQQENIASFKKTNVNQIKWFKQK